MILNLVLFELMLVIGYVYYRFVANKFNFRKKDKRYKQHLKDIVDLLIYGSIIFLLNKNSFVNPVVAIIYFVMFFVNLYVVGYILEIPTLAVPVTKVNEWSKRKISLIILLTIFTIYSTKDLYVLNQRNIALITFLATFAISTSFRYYLNKKNKRKQKFHPHHWQIFWYLALFVAPYDLLSIFISNFFLSMFAHGIISYSAASILED